MNNYKGKSAFYSGATRYGGSSAFAKRREAARKTFFSIKLQPLSNTTTSASTSEVNVSRSNVILIDSDNIIRKQPDAPPLTSSAKRILSWIEQNSAQNNFDTLNIVRKRRVKHRFNPYNFHAISVPATSSDTFDASTSLKTPFSDFNVKPFETTNFKQPNNLESCQQKPAQTSNSTSPSSLQVGIKGSVPTKESIQAYQAPVANSVSTVKLAIESKSKPIQQAPTFPMLAPLSVNTPLKDKFRPPLLKAPITDIIVKPCETKKFEKPISLEPNQKKSVQAPQSVIDLRPEPPMKKQIPTKPSTQIISAPLINSVTASTPVVMTKPEPILKPILAPIPALKIAEGKFKRPILRAPLTDINIKPCETKSFSKPINLDPSQQKPAQAPESMPPPLTPTFIKMPAPSKEQIRPSATPITNSIPVSASITIPTSATPNSLKSTVANSFTTIIPTPVPSVVSSMVPISDKTLKPLPVLNSSTADATIETPDKLASAGTVIATTITPTSNAETSATVTTTVSLEPTITTSTASTTTAPMANTKPPSPVTVCNEIDMDVEMDTIAPVPVPAPAPAPAPVPALASSFSATSNTTSTATPPPFILPNVTLNSFSGTPIASPTVPTIATATSTPTTENTTTNYFQPIAKGGPARRILRAGRRLHR